MEIEKIVVNKWKAQFMRSADLILQLIQHAKTLLPIEAATIALRQTPGWDYYPPDTPAAELQSILTTVYQKRSKRTNEDIQICAIPITYHETRFGAFAVRYTTRLTEQHLLILQNLADQLALNLTLESVEQNLVEVQHELNIHHEISHLATSTDEWDTILPVMAERLAILFDAEACALTLWDHLEQKPQRLAAWGIDMETFVKGEKRPSDIPSLTKRLVSRKVPIFLEADNSSAHRLTPLFIEYGAKTIAALPLVARGKGIGGVFLLRMTSNEPFNEMQAQVAQPSLSHLALAIDNQLLLIQTQQRLEATNALLKIAAVAGSSIDVDQVLQNVLELTRDLLKVKAGAVVLHDTENNALYYRGGSGAFGIEDQYRRLRFPLDDDDNMLVRVFKQGKPILSHDINGLKPELKELAAAMQVGSFLVVPMRTLDHTLGVFFVTDKEGSFSEADIDILSAIASHLSAALRNTQLIQDTRERLRETEALQRIAAITAATLDLNEMLKEALVETTAVLNAEGAQVFLLSTDNQQLVPHEPSLFGAAKQWSQHKLDLQGVGHQVYVFQTGTPYLSNDPSAQTDIQRRNILTIPLQTRQRTLGVLSVGNRRDGDFLESHTDLARAIASQIATSLESIQLFAAEHKRADLMQTVNQLGRELTATLDLRDVSRKVTDGIHNMMGHDFVSINLIDDAGENFVCYASTAANPDHIIETGFSTPIGKGIMTRAMDTGHTQIVPNLHQDPDYLKLSQLQALQSAVVVPLKHGTTHQGNIGVMSMQENAFDEIDVTALENLATQISIAIDNAILYKQVQRRLLEQGIVHQIGQDLTSILDYNELVLAIARHMVRALDTSIAIVSTYNSVYDTIRIEAEFRAPGYEETESFWKVGAAYPISERKIAQTTVTTRNLVTAYEDDEATSADFRKLLKQGGNHAIMSVPLIIGERVVGLISSVERRNPRRFTPTDERLAQTLSTQAAIAMENARLFQETERRAREQALLRQIAFMLSRTHSMDVLVSRFVAEIRRTVDAHNALVGLIEVVHDQEKLVIQAEALTTRTPDQMVLSHLTPQQTVLWQTLKQGDSVSFSPEIENPSAPQQELSRLQQGVKNTVALTPISHRGQLLGVLEVACDPPASAFEITTLQLLESMANQAAIAMENVRLLEREQRRLQQLESIQQSGRLIASELIMQNLLDRVVQEAVKIFEVDAASVSMPDKFQLHHIIYAATELSENFIDRRRVIIDEYPTADMKHEPVYIRELHTLATSKQVDLIQQENIRSALLIPFAKSDQILGRLELYSKNDPMQFTSEDQEMAQLFASQIAVALDNAELFRALEERAKELAEAHRIKNQFLANISHELRTPMNSILGFSETLLGGLYGELNEKQGSRIERIQRNGQNLLALIDDLLDISKIDAGRMEMELVPVDLTSELSALMPIYESLVETKDLYLKLDLPPNLPPIQADLLRLKQLINNLIGNSAKFTRKGGITISVDVKNEVLLSPKPGEQDHREVVWISVSDTGIGISLEDQLVIFDEFRQVDGSTTREFGGTGLGLAICKRLVEMMGGRIWVDSEINEGSTFTFVLPTARN